MADDWLSDTRSSYDTDASGYVEQVRGLLGGRPYLRASLALFTELVQGAGPVADIGCGPGYVTGYLHDDDTRKGILSANGLPDGSPKDAVNLNNLDDWKEFHEAVLK